MAEDEEVSKQELRKGLFEIETLARRGIRGKEVYMPFTYPELVVLMEKIYQLAWPISGRGYEEDLDNKKDSCLEELKIAAAKGPDRDIVRLAKQYCELDADMNRLIDEQMENEEPDEEVESYFKKQHECRQKLREAIKANDRVQIVDLAIEYWLNEDSFDEKKKGVT